MRTAFRVFPTAAVAVVILTASLLPDLRIPDNEVPFMDKILHALAYAALGLFLYLSVYPSGGSWVRAFLVTVVLCFVYGGVIELLQGLTGRTTDILDFCADGVGAAVGAGVSVWIRTLIPRFMPGRGAGRTR